MILLIGLYVWAILAGMVAAPSLAILGVQLATRDRAMQILCIGQGAMLGVLLGIGALHGFEGGILMTVGPFFSALLVSSFTYVVTEMVVKEGVASKNTVFTFIFALLIAISHLVSSLFPGLETHMSQIYFGDLATLSVLDSKIMLVAGLFLLAGLVIFTNSISKGSFEMAVFGKVLNDRGRGEVAFKLVALLTLCLSVQFVGFLFTVGMLFIPTAILSRMQTRGLKLHLTICALLAVSSTLIGFLLSLWQTRLPTVPTIVFLVFLEASLVVGMERLFALKIETKWLEQPVPSEGTG